MLTRNEILSIYADGPEAVVGLIEPMQSALVALTARVQELEERLAKDSHNSSKPPSSDGLAKKPKSLRPATGQSGRPCGGQPGHKGSTLRWVEQPDQILIYRPTVCVGCGSDLPEVADDGACEVTRRQVHDLPPQRLLVTEHRALHQSCPHCRKINQGTFPAAVTKPVQYGPLLQALCVYLQQYQLLPFARTREFLADVMGCSLSQGTLSNILAACHARLAPVESAICAAISGANVAHFDETGMREQSRLHWFHSASTQNLTHYASHARRGRVALEAHGLLPAFRGTAMHDAFVSYFGYSDCSHALCNAHLLRELIAVQEQGNQAWSFALADLLREIKQAVENARTAGDTSLTPEQESAFTARYQAGLSQGLASNPPPVASGQKKARGRTKQSTAKNLLDRLSRYQSEVLRFMTDFTVPFDNNLAERDLRMIKVRQKISGCFRSAQGAATFCRIRGYISTLRKQGCALLTALQNVFAGQPFWPPSLT